MLQRLRNLDMDRIDVDEAVALATFGRQLQEGYGARNLEMPEWLVVNVTALENEIKAIDQEQTRIRQNMMQLDRNSPLYQQYVKKLTDQETRIEKLREEIARLREAEAAAQKELRAYVDSLTVDK